MRYNVGLRFVGAVLLLGFGTLYRIRDSHFTHGFDRCGRSGVSRIFLPVFKFIASENRDDGNRFYARLQLAEDIESFISCLLAAASFGFSDD